MNKKRISVKGVLQNLVVMVLVSGMIVPELVHGQSVNVQVDVPDWMTEPGDRVEIRGDIPGGTWENGIELAQSSEGVWSGTIPASRQLESFTYKYVIVRGNGQEDWETSEDRTYEFSSNEKLPVIKDYLRGFGPELTRRTPVEIRLDLSGLSGPGLEIEAAGVMGSHGDLGWEIPGQITHMESDDGSIWSVQVDFPRGTPADIILKFVWQVEGVWQWEHLPGYQDHLLLVDPDQPTGHSVTFQYNTETSRLEAVGGNGVDADTYREAADYYGGSRSYHYYLAMERLHAGDLPNAEQAYETFAEYFPEMKGGDRDDYFYRKAQYLAGQGLLDRALQLADEQFENESSNQRRAYYQYVKGSLLLNTDRAEPAREAMRRSMELADDADDPHSLQGYARYGLAMGYMKDEDPQQQRIAQLHLHQLAETHASEQMRRTGWQHLARITKDDEDKGQYERAMRGLKENGSPGQRIRSGINWAKHLMDYAAPDSAAAEIQRLEAQADRPELADEVKLLKAEFLLDQGEGEQARQVLLEIEQTRSNNPAAEKARQRLGELDNNSRRNR